MTVFNVRNVIAAAVMVFAFGQSITSHVNAQQTRDLVAQGEWDAATTYAKDDIVTLRGSAWISLKSNNLNKVPGQTQPSTTAWWRVFARGFNPSGPWSNATKYQPDDLVTFHGQTYRATGTSLHKHPNNATYWEVLATKGMSGAIGPQGVQGPPGPNTGLSAGSAAAPAISFSGDSDTGLYSPSAGKIALVEDGALFLHNLGDSNTALGQSALAVNASGFSNSAIGLSALAKNTTGQNNTAVGTTALANLSTGSFNTVLGSGALFANGNGNNNVAIGYHAGLNAGSPSDSVFIGNFGSNGATSTIRIGASQATAFIAGIRGKTTGAADAVNVLIDSNGQLGTVNSSRRYKYDIEAMTDVSALLAKLRPVTFRYKQAQADGTHPPQYGLIAEEIAEVLPDLAVFKDGQPETVKYHLLPSFLLVGWQAQQKTITAQSEKIEMLEERVRKLEALAPKTKRVALHR